MKHLIALVAAMSLASCACAKKDCSSCTSGTCTKAAAACCGKDGKCCKHAH